MSGMNLVASSTFQDSADVVTATRHELQLLKGSCLRYHRRHQQTLRPVTQALVPRAAARRGALGRRISINISSSSSSSGHDSTSG
mmetsp:Transcript_136882/g.341287  ORF Transcript_136882/g.341287 Transcript_136882/m.341287 type:complete len:85 (+) Transcript_136882:327-581(+)